MTEAAADLATPSPTPPGGLDEAEVERRRAACGPNALPSRPPTRLERRILVQLRDPAILLLLVAAVLSAGLGDLRDMAVILLVITVNTVIGVGQEVRAERALEALRALAEPTSRVWREGSLHDVAAVDIVPGDRVLLEAGDIVPADARLAEAVGVEVNESALTGESRPVVKRVGPGEDGAVLAGTVVTRGRGTALVTATGPRSAIGAIASLLGREAPRATPLQRRLTDLGRLLAAAAVVLSVLVLALGLLRGRPVGGMVLTAVSLAVAAVPESLPAVVTLALALGARRMSVRSAIVRRLSAVETLGSVTVFLTDKTGTLTQGRMAVERLCVDEREYAASDGASDSASGEDPDLARLLRDAVLCNDAELRAPDADHPGPWASGEATDAALLVTALGRGVGVEQVRAAAPRLAEIPFDSTRKRMTTVHGHSGTGSTDLLVVCKGAPEALLDTPDLLRSAPPGLREQIRDLASAGYRVLVVAEGTTGQPDAGAAERDLDVVGLLALTDPPREDARELVRTVHGAGIRIAMVTGDHPVTARAIAAGLGIHGEVVSGAQLARPGGVLGAEGPGRATTLPAVFARTRPEQKFDIVAALQERGEVVAMTGDGVNDAPALERADIGVALGRSGTEVAKQAADLVLTDDRLGTVLVAIAEGRRIYTNIRTFLRYALAGGLAEVLVMLLGPFLGLGVPLLPGQILWINLLTHGLPGVAFGAEPGDPDAMHRPPRSPAESVLGHGLWHQVLTGGVLVTAAALAAGVLAPDSTRQRQTAVFLTLGLAQLGIALALRRWTRRPRPVGFLDLAVASSVLLQLAAVYVAPLAGLLDTAAVPARHALLLVAVAAVPGLLVLVSRLDGRAGRPRRTGH